MLSVYISSSHLRSSFKRSNFAWHDVSINNTISQYVIISSFLSQIPLLEEGADPPEPTAPQTCLPGKDPLPVRSEVNRELCLKMPAVSKNWVENISRASKDIDFKFSDLLNTEEKNCMNHYEATKL